MTNTPARTSDDEVRKLTCAIIAPVRRSERGYQALIDFRTLLDNGGWGLDAENWKALGTLCLIAEKGKGFALDEYLPRKS